MALAIVKRKKDDNYRGIYMEEGYYYSSYTHEDAHFANTFRPLKDYLGDNSEYKLTIFESEEAAQHFINEYFKYSGKPEDFEVVKLWDVAGE